MAEVKGLVNLEALKDRVKIDAGYTTRSRIWGPKKDVDESIILEQYKDVIVGQILTSLSRNKAFHPTQLVKIDELKKHLSGLSYQSRIDQFLRLGQSSTVISVRKEVLLKTLKLFSQYTDPSILIDLLKGRIIVEKKKYTDFEIDKLYRAVLVHLILESIRQGNTISKESLLTKDIVRNLLNGTESTVDDIDIDKAVKALRSKSRVIITKHNLRSFSATVSNLSTLQDWKDIEEVVLNNVRLSKEVQGALRK